VRDQENLFCNWHCGFPVAMQFVYVMICHGHSRWLGQELQNAGGGLP
jgi:hypothetical protein